MQFYRLASFKSPFLWSGWFNSFQFIWFRTNWMLLFSHFDFKREFFQNKTNQKKFKTNSKQTRNKPKKNQQKTVAGFLLWQIRVTGWPEAGKKKDWSPPISLFPYCKLLVVFASLSKRVTLSIQVLYVFPGSVCLDHWAFGSHPATWWNSLWFPVM